MATKRIASQVHKQASRLLREGYIQREPAWYRAVLDHPPLPLPARKPPSRTDYDLPPSEPETRPSTDKVIRARPVEYVEDEIRRQFFRDHPFEAFRATTLVEAGAIESEHPIRGAEWRRLIQRGRNPSAEDAIRYALNLHEHHGMSKSKAYASAVAQFRSLRSEHEIMRQVARTEAEHNGMVFGSSQVDIQFSKEEKALATFRDTSEQDRSEETERKRWKAVVQREGPPEKWTRGQQYTRLWQEGVRPVYAPVFSAPAITPAGLAPPQERTAERIAQEAFIAADFMR